MMRALLGDPGRTFGRNVMATIPVPDARVDRLAGIFRPKKTTFARVDMSFDDAACQTMKETLAEVQTAEVLVLAARAFDLDPSGRDDPATVFEQYRSELVLTDLMLVEKRLESIARWHEITPEKPWFERLKGELEEGKLLSQVEYTDQERAMFLPYNCLTLKPLIVVFNVAEGAVASANREACLSVARWRGATPVTLCAKVEEEIAALEPAERGPFLEALGIPMPAAHNLVQAVFAGMNLISFLTVGEDEVRAWPVRRGACAPEAGGRVHSDIQRGLIRAEVVSYDDFVAAGSLRTARANGTLRLEGKSYVVQDGDIINFLFKV